MSTNLTQEHIESAINALPIQGRVMLRLLLVQYFDLTQEEIEYMVSDRPDPRLQAGAKVTMPVISRDAIQGIADRVAEYRSRMRQRRERTWLQGECLRRMISRTESLCAIAQQLLVSKFGLALDTIEDLKTRARTALPKPVIRELDQRWDRHEVTEDDYRTRRLSVEYQTQLRHLDRLRKRAETAKREYETASRTSLQDHEIGHIWGIPASSLAARKVKYLPQYLQALHAKVRDTAPDGDRTPPIDFWKETFAVLSHRPAERSIASYDGLEGTEAALIEKLTAFAAGTLPEEVEGRFWLTLIQESIHAAEYGSKVRSLFGLQRLAAIQAEMETSPEALEEELLARVSPAPKIVAGELEESQPADAQLGEMGQHVLRSMMGEDRN
jgi:hypothetical protein